MWRRGRDSNPREIALKLISSQPRYDRFDTSPFMSRALRHPADVTLILAGNGSKVNTFCPVKFRSALCHDG